MEKIIREERVKKYFLVCGFNSCDQVMRHRDCVKSGNSPENMRKICISTKLQHQKTRWNYSILCREGGQDLKNISKKEWNVWYSLCLNNVRLNIKEYPLFTKLNKFQYVFSKVYLGLCQTYMIANFSKIFG